MTKLLIGGLIAAAFTVSLPALAQPTASAAPPRAAQAPKSRADVQSAVARRFARIDANHDGFVSKAEAAALQAKRGERKEQRTDKRAARLDPAKVFARLDGNKDGTITRAEAEAARTARMTAKGKPAAAHAMAFGGLFDRADKNRDGAISRAEFDSAPPKAGTRNAGMKGGRMFEMGDANKDGRVSLAEAEQGALRRFDRFDLNHDGRITPEERSQARQQLRAQRKPS